MTSIGVSEGTQRQASRTIKVLEVPSLVGWPQFIGLARLARLRRTVTRNGKKTVEVVYLVTSSGARSASPAVLAAWILRPLAHRESLALGA